MRNPPDHRDNNEPEIMRALEAMGALVVPLRDSVTGNNKLYTKPPDLLVGFNGWFTVEVKSKDGRLKPDQEEFRDVCKYRGLPHYIIRNTKDAEKALKEMGQL